MIKIQGKIPRSVYLACSGGVDSMAVLHFLRKNHHVTVLHYNHGTSHGAKADSFMTEYCYKNQIPLYKRENKKTIPIGASKEAFWRECRYNFFYEFDDKPIVMCHHLDDCVETWVWSSMHGEGKIIPYRNHNIIRPFRLTRKRDLELWCTMNNVPWIEDESNENIHYTRNFIRHEMMENVLRVNPGIHKTIKKKVLDDSDSIVCETSTSTL